MITLICEDEMSLKPMMGLLAQAEFEHRGVLLADAESMPDIVGDTALMLLVVEQMTPETLSLCGKWNTEMGCAVLVIGTFNTEAEQLVAYEAGVAECMTRMVGAPVLAAKLRVWLRFTSTSAAMEISVQHGPFALNTQTRDLTIGDTSVRLTINEARLLQLLLKHPKRVIPPDQIYQHLGLSVHDNTTALKNIIYRLRRKLIPIDPDLRVLIWRENGYVFLP